MSADDFEDCGNVTYGVNRTFIARNTGPLPLYVHGFDVGGKPCVGAGFRVFNCEGFHLPPTSSKRILIIFTPDFSMSRIQQTLEIHTTLGDPIQYMLQATIPTSAVQRCRALIPRPSWEFWCYFLITSLSLVFIVLIPFTGFWEADGVIEVNYRMWQDAWDTPEDDIYSFNSAANLVEQLLLEDDERLVYEEEERYQHRATQHNTPTTHHINGDVMPHRRKRPYAAQPSRVAEWLVRRPSRFVKRRVVMPLVSLFLAAVKGAGRVLVWCSRPDRKTEEKEGDGQKADGRDDQRMKHQEVTSSKRSHNVSLTPIIDMRKTQGANNNKSRHQPANQREGKIERGEVEKVSDEEAKVEDVDVQSGRFSVLNSLTASGRFKSEKKRERGKTASREGKAVENAGKHKRDSTDKEESASSTTAESADEKNPPGGESNGSAIDQQFVPARPRRKQTRPSSHAATSAYARAPISKPKVVRSTSLQADSSNKEAESTEAPVAKKKQAKVKPYEAGKINGEIDLPYRLSKDGLSVRRFTPISPKLVAQARSKLQQAAIGNNEAPGGGGRRDERRLPSWTLHDSDSCSVSSSDLSRDSPSPAWDSAALPVASSSPHDDFNELSRVTEDFASSESPSPPAVGGGSIWGPSARRSAFPPAPPGLGFPDRIYERGASSAVQVSQGLPNPMVNGSPLRPRRPPFDPFSDPNLDLLGDPTPPRAPFGPSEHVVRDTFASSQGAYGMEATKTPGYQGNTMMQRLQSERKHRLAEYQRRIRHEEWPGIESPAINSTPLWDPTPNNASTWGSVTKERGTSIWAPLPSETSWPSPTAAADVPFGQQRNSIWKFNPSPSVTDNDWAAQLSPTLAPSLPPAGLPSPRTPPAPQHHHLTRSVSLPTSSNGTQHERNQQ